MKKVSLSGIFILGAVFAIILVSSVWCEENQTFRFAILGDRTGGHVPGIYGEIVGEIELLKPDFVITVGDQIEGYVDDSTEITKEWQEYDSIVAPLTMPLYFTPGNHDTWSPYAADWFKNHKVGPSYSFDHDQVHFVVLDVGQWNTSDDIPEDEINWLVDDLTKNKDATLTFVFMHKPFWEGTIAAGKPDKLHDIFVKYGVDAVFSGHYHEYFSGDFDGIAYTSFGTSGAEVEVKPAGLSYHFGWVTVKGDNFDIAVIKKNSVLPRDIATVDEKRIYDRMIHYGLNMDKPLMVPATSTIAPTPFSLTIDNSLSSEPFSDTLRWNVPEGWKITPAVAEMTVPPGEKATAEFTAACNGPLFPVPRVSTMFTYAKDKQINVNGKVRVCKTAVCNKKDGKLKLDGLVKESLWKDPVTQFYAPDGSENQLDPVKFYFAYDKDNLYLAAYCQDNKIDSLVAHIKDRDGSIFGEDCVGYFIEPKNGSDTVYQVYFSALGTITDMQAVRAEDGYMNFDWNWNGDYDVKTAKGKDFWSIEVKVPLKQFGITAASGENWHINFRRKQKRFNSACDWQVPIGAYPENMGILSFQ